LATFSEITSEHLLIPFNDNSKHGVQNINLVPNTVENTDIVSDNGSTTCTNETDVKEFSSNFGFDHSDMDDSQITTLRHFLYDNKDIFVTKQSPDLGFTDLVQHKIILRPDAKPKYQRPYRLSPDKKKVLRHHLDNLLNQGIISAVSPDEDLSITSPIVLVTKRTHSKKGPPYDKDASLSQFRFCCDFRHFNSQTFSYAIPDLQELTESFTERTSNFITSIDFFFQMKIDPNSSKYTAFNTCFGTFKFNRLPMGLSSAPNSFQLLMDKVLFGLTFKSCLCYLDDVLVCSETFDGHLQDLKRIQSFQKSRSKIKSSKVFFRKIILHIFGTPHIVTRNQTTT